VALFTAHHGILGVIAKGSKRQSKKGAGNGSISGPLDLLTAGQVVFIPAKGTTELGTLAGWELLDPRGGLRTNLPALNAAYVCAEITLGLLHAHDPHDDLFLQLEATLRLLATPQQSRALVAYLKAALTAAGYQPHLDACVECGKRTTPDDAWRFSPRAGGIVCAQCPATGPTLPVPGRIALALDRLESPTQLATTTDRPADPTALRVATNLLLTHIETLLDRNLRTRYLLK
jgi:DNA repair protein RecO (recombination protein O)